MLTLLLMILVIMFALGVGGWGYTRYGWMGISPTGFLLLVLCILYFTGNLHFS